MGYLFFGKDTFGSLLKEKVQSVDAPVAYSGLAMLGEMEVDFDKFCKRVNYFLVTQRLDHAH